MRKAIFVALIAAAIGSGGLTGVFLHPAEAGNGWQGPVRKQVAGPGNGAGQRGANVAGTPQQSNQFISGYENVPRQNNFGPCYPFGCNYKGPSYPFGNNYAKAPLPAPPVYVQPQRQWMPGHWAKQWVPQYYAYQAWVPGYFSNAGWVPGYYEQRVGESGGYYQQVWVDGYWQE